MTAVVVDASVAAASCLRDDEDTVAADAAMARISDLEDCLRLEVSGVDRGPEQTVRQRLNAKLRQAAAGDSNLPALAGVVGFKARLIAIAELSKI